MALKPLGILLSIPRIRLLRVKELLMSGWFNPPFFPKELAFRSFLASLGVAIPKPVMVKQKTPWAGKGAGYMNLPFPLRIVH